MRLRAIQWSAAFGTLRPSRAAIFITALLLLLCSCERTIVEPRGNQHPVSLADIPQATWQRLAERRIYFGHQSVGANILDGIRDWERDDPRIRLNIVQEGALDAPGPAFLESRIGKNGEPLSKIAAFLAALDRGAGGSDGIVMFKFCYLDMTPATDEQRLFDAYQAAVEQTHATHPGLTLVHITMPLTLVESPAKAFVKSILRKPTQRELGRKRNRFNELLRQRYGGKEPIFDLAAVESTRADGSRVTYTIAGTTAFSLAPEFTDDGAHLNVVGRRWAAEQLLRTLATLLATADGERPGKPLAHPR